MKRLVVAAGFLVALALSGTAHAQSGAARGKVLDDKGEALQDAKVEIEYMGGVTRRYQLKTSKKGEYTQVGMPPGEYKVTVTKDGYQGGYVTLRIGLGEPTVVPDFKLLSAAAAAAKAGGGAKADQVGPAFKAAYELTQQGKLDEAEAAYKEILAKTPDIPEVYYNLGVVTSKKKDFAAAEGYYRKVIELQADNVDGWVALAENYQFMNQPDKVVETFNQALAAQADNPKLLFGLGTYYFNNGKPEAGEILAKVAQLDPSNGDVHFYLGSLAIGKNDKAGAIKHFETYLGSSPTNPQNKATAEGLLQYLKK